VLYYSQLTKLKKFKLYTVRNISVVIWCRLTPANWRPFIFYFILVQKDKIRKESALGNVRISYNA